MLLFAPYLTFFFLLFGKRDKHSCSASAIFSLSMVSIVDSLLSSLPASANRILRFEANAYFIGSGYAGSLSFFFSGCRPRFSCPRGFAAQHSRARALPLLNLKKKRDCSLSKVKINHLNFQNLLLVCTLKSVHQKDKKTMTSCFLATLTNISENILGINFGLIRP